MWEWLSANLRKYLYKLDIQIFIKLQWQWGEKMYTIKLDLQLYAKLQQQKIQKKRGNLVAPNLCEKDKILLSEQMPFWKWFDLVTKATIFTTSNANEPDPCLYLRPNESKSVLPVRTSLMLKNDETQAAFTWGTILELNITLLKCSRNWTEQHKLEKPNIKIVQTLLKMTTGDYFCVSKIEKVELYLRIQSHFQNFISRKFSLSRKQLTLRTLQNLFENLLTAIKKRT